ncbi:MAG: hypothetical protein NDI94_05725 [Candidatus Woesearchaeota archaeon]|nr:hypothetical protein [Candidatus Woesearchaeota archaeon]
MKSTLLTDIVEAFYGRGATEEDFSGASTSSDTGFDNAAMTRSLRVIGTEVGKIPYQKNLAIEPFTEIKDLLKDTYMAWFNPDGEIEYDEYRKPSQLRLKFAVGISASEFYFRSNNITDMLKAEQAHFKGRKSDITNIGGYVMALWVPGMQEYEVLAVDKDHKVLFYNATDGYVTALDKFTSGKCKGLNGLIEGDMLSMEHLNSFIDFLVSDEFYQQMDKRAPSSENYRQVTCRNCERTEAYEIKSISSSCPGCGDSYAPEQLRLLGAGKINR